MILQISGYFLDPPLKNILPVGLIAIYCSLLSKGMNFASL